MKSALMTPVRIKLNCYKSRNHGVSTVFRDANLFPAKTFYDGSELLIQ